MNRRLTQHYDKLTAVERFQLSLAALARCDETEAKQLADTCPVASYRQRDPEYARCIEASTTVVMALTLELAPHLEVIRFLDAQADYVNTCLVLVEAVGFDTAIDAHWRALDPDGTANRDQLPLPDVEAMAVGAAGLPYYIAERLRSFWGQVRARAVTNVAVILAGFDAFTTSEWALSGDDALKEFADVLWQLDPLRAELGKVEVDCEAAHRAETCFQDLWKAMTA